MMLDSNKNGYTFEMVEEGGLTDAELDEAALLIARWIIDQTNHVENEESTEGAVEDE